MRKYTDADILARTERLPSFAGWKVGIYLICVRSRSDQYDRFDDKAFLYVVKSPGSIPTFLMECGQVTTNTGSYGLINFDQYNTRGVAILKSDHIVYNSHAYGLHKRKTAYRQAKGFPYHRDNNRDRRADEVGPIYTDVIYANIHRAGQHSTIIGNWSTGCIVFASEHKFTTFLAAMAALGRPSISLAILKEF